MLIFFEKIFIIETMKISEILKSKKLTFSFEVFPPKQQGNFDSVAQTVTNLAELSPDWISVTYGAGGATQSNTIEISKFIQKQNVSALTHLTCINTTKENLEDTLQKMKEAGVENILALRGDIPNGVTFEQATQGGYKHASDLVPLLKQKGFCVGGACYPEGHIESANRIDDIERLKFKVDAGVDFLTTQMFFDNDMLYSFLYRMESSGIHLPVFPGIMPITNVAQIPKMIRLSNAYIPKKLLAICDRFGTSPDALRQAGIAYATDQIIDLISNGIRGIHIYTMNKSETAKSILANIRDIISASNQ